MLFSIFIIFISCSKENPTEMNIDTSIDISVKNSEGIDLLNPNNSNSFKEQSISIYYLTDGELTLYNEPNLDYPNGFFIFQHENEYRLRLFPNTSSNESLPETVIKWNSSESDALKCNIEKTDNSEICTKVWLNDILVWENNSDRYIQIVK